MAQTKAHIKATNKYIAKAYDRVNLTMPKGDKERVRAYAESKGLSLNAYINKLIKMLFQFQKIIMIIHYYIAHKKSCLSKSYNCIQLYDSTDRMSSMFLSVFCDRLCNNSMLSRMPETSGSPGYFPPPSKPAASFTSFVFSFRYSLMYAEISGVWNGTSPKISRNSAVSSVNSWSST